METSSMRQQQLTRDDFDGGPVSLNEIIDGLYLGNLTAATSLEILRLNAITHVLTLDSVPLPQHVTEATFLTTKYVQIADLPKEDILHHLDGCIDFIVDAINSGGKILVHCYFGVSRSSSVVIAYIMKSRQLEYEPAFEFVKSQRRFVQPNNGFIAQLKLWHFMGYNIDIDCLKYKLYRLRLAGEQMRKVKILPNNFNNVICPDPSVIHESPEPIVYRCRKCRRILASKSHVLPHSSGQSLTKNFSNKTSILFNKEFKHNNSVNIMEEPSFSSVSNPDTAVTNTTLCQPVIFVEPIAWMKDITHQPQGRLYCPKCNQKLGNFSWINGCHCPCGKEVCPAFYLVSSKVELTKAVQNVQKTL